MTDPIPLFRRVVVTKNGTIYELEPDQAGTPAVDVFVAKIAASLRIADATVYEVADKNWPGGKRRIIARPDGQAAQQDSP